MNCQPSIETIPSSARSNFGRRNSSRRSLAIGSREFGRVFPIACMIAALTSVALADTRFSIEGELGLGTDQMNIPFHLSASAEIFSPLGFRTLSHSGGINSAGEVIPAGGFDPTLTLFNSAATQIAYVDDGTGIEFNYDSVLNFFGGTPAIPSPLAAGDYTLRLEPESDSFSSRTQNWAVELTGSDDVLSLTLTDIGQIPGYRGISKVAVTGPGSKWTNASYLTVGDYSNSTGKLLIKAGGMVSTTNGYVGFASNSMGEVTVTGTGSMWTNSNELRVGLSGNATLLVEAGGKVSDKYGLIGHDSGSTGLATITGSGSKWINSLELVLGSGGNGTLLVAAGGMVSNTFGYIGYGYGSVCVATVTGSGSTWTNASDLTLGYYGTGTLLVEDGGVVSNVSCFLGRFVNSTGIATVTGPGSTWNASESLAIGGTNDDPYGNGTLSITDSGLVTVGTTTKLWSTGSISLTAGGILNTGLLDIRSGSFEMQSGGRLEANTVLGDLVNLSGVVAPGKNSGVMTVSRTYDQGAMATLAIELRGVNTNEFDVLSVTGMTTLGGTLDVSLLSGFNPSAGDRFDVLTAALVQGTFATELLPTLTGGLQWLVDYRTDGVSLLVSSASLAGDYNADGLVNAADYTVWRDHLGAPAGTLVNDPAGGVIGTAQYAQWKAHFGQTVGAGSGVSSMAAVPEPATLMLLMFAAAGWCLRRGRAA